MRHHINSSASSQVLSSNQTEELDLSQRALMPSELIDLLFNSERTEDVTADLPYTLKKKILFGLLISTGLCSGIPFYRPATQFIGEDTTLGRVMGVSTIICFGSIGAWMTSEFLKIYYSSISCIDKIVGETLRKKNRRILIAFFMGVLSSIPSLFLSYHFNDENIIYPFLVLITSWAFRTMGYYKFIIPIESMLTQLRCIRCCVNDTLERAKKNASLLLRQLSREVPTLDENILSDSFHKTDKFKNALYGFAKKIEKNDEKNAHSTLLIHSTTTEAEKFWHGGLLLMSTSVGAMLPAAAVSINFFLIYKALNTILGLNSTLSTILAIVLEIPDAAITISSSVNLLQNIYIFLYDAVRFPSRQNFYVTHFKKSTFIAASLAVIISSFSFGSSATALKDQFPEEIAFHLLPLFILSDSFFHFYGLMSNYMNVVNAYIQAKSDQITRLRLKCTHNLEYLASVIYNKSSQFYASLVTPSAAEDEAECVMGENTLGPS